MTVKAHVLLQNSMRKLRLGLMKSPRNRMLLRSIAVALVLSAMSVCTVSEPVLSRNVALRRELDAIFVIGMKQCEERWRRVLSWADENSLDITPIHATTFNQINLQEPPIPILGMPAEAEVMTGQVGCTVSHIRTWRQAFSRNLSNILVLEDDVRLTPSLLARIPQIMADAKEGSRRRNWLPWHFIFLRMHSTVPSQWKQREVWHGQVNVAIPGWGTAAYIASGTGIRYLLTRVTSYSHPLDVQIERLQRGLDEQGAKFIALDVCAVERKNTLILGCPENIDELSLQERGSCHYSASQMGQLANGSQFPGAVQTQSAPGSHSYRIRIDKWSKPRS